MDSNSSSSSSNNCGKVCLFSCLGCFGLGVVLFLVLLIASCAGCTAFLGMFGGLFQAIGNVAKISSYFDDLESKGWEVDDSQSNQPSGYGSNVEAGTPMVWRARENRNDEWTDYVWELGPADPEAFRSLEEDGNMDNFKAAMNWVLIPRTEAALDVHEELGLPLPDNFELDPIDLENDHEGDNNDNNGHENLKPGHGDNNDDESAGNDEEDSGNDDESTSSDDDENSDTSGDGDEDNPPAPRHGKHFKSWRLAA
jgi:hypothetical protein